MVKNIGVVIDEFCMMMTKVTYNDTLHTLLGGELYDATGMKDYTLIDEYMYQINESVIRETQINLSDSINKKKAILGLKQNWIKRCIGISQSKSMKL
jgi:Mg2+/Co2+ transporter CorB